MNKLIHTLGLAAILSVSSITTLPVYALKYDLSQGFKEPTEGSLKVMLLKNGNTAMINVTPKDGIFIKLFDAGKRPIAELNHESDVWESGKMKKAEIKGVYEIDGNIVLFIQQSAGRKPMLFRLVIDGKNGKMLKEDPIGDLRQATNNLPARYSSVEKDAYSDNYAVALFPADEKDQRFQVVHYNKQHQEISRGDLSAADINFKRLDYANMVVLGEKSVVITAFGSNPGKKNAQLIVGKLEKGSTSFKHKLLDYANENGFTRTAICYNPQSDVITLLSITMMDIRQKFLSNKSTTSYMPLLTFIDPNSFALLKVMPLQTPKLDELARKNEYKNGFTGLPQDIYVNKNNTYTVIMEEITQEVIYYSKTSRIVTYLGNMGVSTLDASGNELSSSFIPKSQMVKAELYKELYVNERRNTVQDMSYGNQFLSFAYAEGKNNTGYIFLNDYEKNEEALRKGKIYTVTTISGTDAFCYVLRNGDFQREYVFGNPDGKKDKRFAMFSVSDYKPETHTYATIMIDKEGGNKVAKMAWLYLD